MDNIYDVASGKDNCHLFVDRVIDLGSQREVLQDAGIWLGGSRVPYDPTIRSSDAYKSIQEAEAGFLGADSGKKERKAFRRVIGHLCLQQPTFPKFGSFVTFSGDGNAGKSLVVKFVDLYLGTMLVRPSKAVIHGMNPVQYEQENSKLAGKRLVVLDELKVSKPLEPHWLMNLKGDVAAKKIKGTGVQGTVKRTWVGALLEVNDSIRFKEVDSSMAALMGRGILVPFVLDNTEASKARLRLIWTKLDSKDPEYEKAAVMWVADCVTDYIKYLARKDQDSKSKTLEDAIPSHWKEQYEDVLLGYRMDVSGARAKDYKAAYDTMFTTGSPHDFIRYA